MTRSEAISRLRKLLNKGDTVYTIIRHVSQSGMSREISMVTVRDGEIVSLDLFVKIACGRKIGHKNGIKVKGCGMDMGFVLVSELSEGLFGDYDALNQRWL